MTVGQSQAALLRSILSRPSTEEKKESRIERDCRDPSVRDMETRCFSEHLGGDDLSWIASLEFFNAESLSDSVLIMDGGE